MKRILFLVNGYGLGNSTRIHGIIQNIPEDYTIDILADGNSLKYFKQVSRVSSLFQGVSVEYGIKKGRIDFWFTLGKIFTNLKAIFKNRNILKKILKLRHYELIVSDSHFSAFFLKNRPKLISINNADVIIKRALKIKKKALIFNSL